MSSSRQKLLLVHTSPAAIGPLTDYYSRNAPDLELANLLDDGLLRLFAAGDQARSVERLANLIRYGVEHEGSAACLLTCSAVSRSMLRTLQAGLSVPALKIDDLLAERALVSASKLGILITFAPSRAATEQLFKETRAELGSTAEIDFHVVPGAYTALLRGDTEQHDELLLAEVERLAWTGHDAVVLSQVSMSRILSRLPAGLSIPVFSSLPISLEAVRKVMHS